ncbi:MAG: glycosyltransferase family 39 protein [Ardenticatenaceae bacterium]|nr:glycosyltransferase family 39 protein [Ardenticatenaceae bacterium]
MKRTLFVALIGAELLIMAVVGQASLQDEQSVGRGLWLLAAAVLLFGLLLAWQGEAMRPKWLTAVALPPGRPLVDLSPRYRLGLTAVTLIAALNTFFGLGRNQFTPLGFTAWIVTIVCFVLAFAEKPTWRFQWRPEYWLLLLILLIGFFYRFYRLNGVPVEFGSDQIEKLLDVYDVLSGQRPLFFPRNTGREMVQFYWTAFLIRFTPLELSFTALKVGTGIFSVWTLGWVYLLGKELYGRWVGLLAELFMAMSHWHIAITRIGLRFVFTGAFFTPTLYFLIRAYRYNRRNDWLAAGAFLGLGLHTYIPMRMVPVVLVVLTAVKLLFDFWQKYRPQTPPPFAESTALSWRFWWNALLGGFTSLVFFLPLLRYMADFPEMFWYRASSRLTNGESLNYGQIFWDNTKRAWLMFNYRGDSVYANNLPHSPMLDDVTAALFLLGLVYLLWQLVRYRDRRSLYLFFSIAIMLLPSILSFTFTGENPSAVRTGGAIPVVMVTAVLPLYAVWHYSLNLTSSQFPLLPLVKLRETQGNLSARVGRVVVTAVIASLITAALLANYNWYFVQYDQNYRSTALNHSELADVAHDFIQRGGTLENVYHVAYPYWTDTRAIAILNGQPYWNQAVHNLEDLAQLTNPRVPQLFLINLEDTEAVQLLTRALPQGELRRYHSAWSPDKDFFVYETRGE